MEKMIKKNIKISKVSFSIGKAEITATIRTLRPLTLEIDFKGLKTLNVLRPETLKLALPSSGPG
jgi:hypothetical protein